jgi:hypothetical protein
MRLNPDLELFAQVFGMRTALPIMQMPEIEQISAAVSNAAATVLNLQWQVQPLSDAELAAIQASS